MLSEIGIQSYTYQESSFEEFCEAVELLNIEAVELYSGHLGPESTPDEREMARDRLAHAGVSIDGIGVYSIDGETEIEDIFALGDDLGCEYLSVGFASADARLVEPVLERAESYDLPIAVHNTPAGTFATIEDVRELLAAYQDSLFGVCLDTGNYVDAGDDVEDAVSAFSDRIHAVHLKGYHDEHAEPVADADVVEFLTDLDERSSFAGTPMIEYEVNPAAPAPAVQALLDSVTTAASE